MLTSVCLKGYVIGTADSPQTCPVPVGNGFDCPSNGLFQDRAAAYVGLRVSKGRTIGKHTLSYGVDLPQEDFKSNVAIAFASNENPNGPTAGPFLDVSAQRGSNTAAYVEDVWAPNARLAIKPGLRYDHSTGYVSGAQLSPRFEVDETIAPGTVAHAYLGRYYAAPGLEDTRREAVITNTSPTATPVYDSVARARHLARVWRGPRLRFRPAGVRERLRPHRGQRARYHELAQYAALRSL
jgi:hypothetical protein